MRLPLTTVPGFPDHQHSLAGQGDTPTTLSHRVGQNPVGGEPGGDGGSASQGRSAAETPRPAGRSRLRGRAIDQTSGGGYCDAPLGAWTVPHLARRLATNVIIIDLGSSG